MKQIRWEGAHSASDSSDAREPVVTTDAAARAQFTPGPWLITTDGTAVYALMPDVDRPTVQVNRFFVSIQGHYCPRDEKEANARLIAAAPELLGCLIEITENAARDDSRMWMRAFAAIKKARGD